MQRALAEANRRGHRAVLLVGDAAYYGRFGFSPELTGKLWLPGLAEKHRLLGLELVPGALDGARGAIGIPRKQPRTRLIATVGGLMGTPAPKAA
jgi:predicted N-acetyltransferase YhbS